MPSKIKNIVIAGGGTAGWMAASLLSKLVSDTISVTLVESDDIPTVGVGEATIPPLQTFHKILNLDEREFLSKVDGTFKLGISFENWRHKGHEYIHSFGRAGRDCWACTFLHFWLAGKAMDVADSYEAYCTELLAAREKKFGLLPNTPINYAYHIDAGRYAAVLREYSEARGVVRREGKIDDVVVSEGDGTIAALELAGGERIEGDFFIDCTGFKALLMEGALHAGYEDWSHWLPCDRAIAVQTEPTGEPPLPYTRSMAHEAGWQWRIPLQSRVGNGFVYSSRYMDDEQALEMFRNNLQGHPINEPKFLRFRTGMRRHFWKKNCVAVGLSSGFLEPLESTSIHLIQQSLVRLMQLFPFNGLQQSDVDEYNWQMREDVYRVRDFIILHYKVTEREDSRFWRYCKNMDVPQELDHRIRLFSESGRIFKVGGELFSEESWTQVMMGQGLAPEGYHPFVKSLGDEAIEKFLNDIKASKAQTVKQLPQHGDFLARYCPSNIKRC